MKPISSSCLLSVKRSQKKKYKRKVNWREYNESLVRRGELLFDTDFLLNWRAELREMNKGKEGARFRYPNSLIWQTLLTSYNINLAWSNIDQS
jgi:hypothetical protein